MFVQAGRLAAIVGAALTLISHSAPASAQESDAMREARDTAVMAFLDRCVAHADFDDRKRTEVFWNQLYTLGYSPGQILEVTQTLGDDCEYISIKAAVMQLAAQLGIERGERPTAPPPVVTTVDEHSAEIAEREVSPAPPQPADGAQDEAAAEATPLTPEEAQRPTTRVYATPIDQFLDQCLDSPDDRDRDLAEAQQGQLFAMGYDIDRIVELFRQLPEDCSYISYKTAVTSLGWQQEELRRQRRAAEAAKEASQPRTTRRGERVDRLIGFAMNLGFGAGHLGTYNFTPEADFTESHFDVELPGFELRLFPAPDFSIDLLWQLGDMAWFKSKDFPDSFAGSVFFHIHGPPASIGGSMNIGFAAAPGLSVTIQNGETIEIMDFAMGMDAIGVGAGTRLGVDLTSDSGLFGLGIYLRPGVHATVGAGGEIVKSHELLFEVNVGLYVLRPAGS